KSANEPTALLLWPVSLKRSASVPRAVLSWPEVLSNIAAVPTAVLESDPAPLVRASAPAPRPVLKLPLPTIKSENQPTPVFQIGRAQTSRQHCYCGLCH